MRFIGSSFLLPRPITTLLSTVTDRGRCSKSSARVATNDTPSMNSTLIDQYAAGPELLADVFRDSKNLDVDAQPIPGTWSIRQVICHLADSEIVYADRIKRVLAEENPTFFEADPNQFVPALHTRHRPLQTELDLISAVRSHMLSILRSLDAEQFQRIGQHSLDGQMTIETLLQRITDHIPHHLRFINAKIKKL